MTLYEGNPNRGGTSVYTCDFTFTEIIGQVGVKGAGEPFVNKDVVKAKLIKSMG